MKLVELRQKVQEARFVPMAEVQDGKVVLAQVGNVSICTMNTLHYESDEVFHIFAELPVGDLVFVAPNPVSLLQDIFDIARHFSVSVARVRYLCNVYNYRVYDDDEEGHTIDTVAIVETYSNRAGLQYFVFEGMLYNQRFSAYTFPMQFSSIGAALDYVREQLELRFQR